MSELITAVRLHPRRALLIGAGIGVSVLALQAIYKRFFTDDRRQRLPRLKATWKLSNRCEIDVSALNAAIDGLESLLNELEPQKFNSELGRGRYDLVSSIIARLKGICSDLQRYVTEDFRKRTTTEEIAKTIWSERSMPRAGTLSVLSDDSFLSACEDFIGAPASDLDVSISTDFAHMRLYNEGLKSFDEGRVKYRKSRAEFCNCDSEQDFAAKLHCLRKAFNEVMEDEHTMIWLIQSGRVLIADLLRHDGRDPTEFYTAYDRMMAFLQRDENRETIRMELSFRKVEEVNLWDVLIDYVILDAFDDLRKPPSSITALVKNTFLSQSMKESTLNNLIWSLIKMKRARMQVQDGFAAHFYDISQALTASLTMGLLGGSSREFEELCVFFKDSIFAFIAEIFNPNKVRYTKVDELAEDVKKLLVERVEIIKVKMSTELLPS